MGGNTVEGHSRDQVHLGLEAHAKRFSQVEESQGCVHEPLQVLGLQLESSLAINPEE